MPSQLAQTDMLIRSPRETVYDAFVDPDVLTRFFWLRRTSGPLALDVTVEWEFMAEGSTETVVTTELASPTRIGFSWSDGIDVTIRIDTFETTMTRVFVEAGPFDGDDAASDAVAATAGFTIVLCDLKTFLENGRSAGLVRDKAVLITADTKAS